jgi:hypothetical protein
MSAGLLSPLLLLGAELSEEEFGGETVSFWAISLVNILTKVVPVIDVVVWLYGDVELRPCAPGA